LTSTDTPTDGRTQQGIENGLWETADELCVAMPEAQYSSVVFPLMFWKYPSDT
jgi:type I restriction enzyme M protein